MNIPLKQFRPSAHHEPGLIVEALHRAGSKEGMKGAQVEGYLVFVEDLQEHFYVNFFGRLVFSRVCQPCYKNRNENPTAVLSTRAPSPFCGYCSADPRPWVSSHLPNRDGILAVCQDVYRNAGADELRAIVKGDELAEKLDFWRREQMNLHLQHTFRMN